MSTIPKSLRNAIDEEPERFLSYLDIDEIASADNPYKEFLTQFKNAFSSANGLNLWQYVENKYNILNDIFKHSSIQSAINEEFLGSLKRKEAKEFFEEQLEEVTETQEEREEKVKKPVKVVSHTRNGKEIKGYVKTKSHRYTERQERFILSRRKFPINLLADEFNRSFETSLTSIGLRDKRLRLLGKK